MTQKESVESRKNLGEFEYGCVLEISRIDCTDGQYAIAQNLTKRNKARETGKVVLPGRLMDDPSVVSPVVLLYFGEEESQKGLIYYNIKVHPCGNEKKMRKSADQLPEVDPKSYIILDSN